MKWSIQIGMIFAFGAIMAACDKGSSVEDNTVQTHKLSRPLPPKCSIHHPLACKSSGILMVGPDFVGELYRFLGAADFDRDSVNDPRYVPFGPGIASLKPEPLDGGITFVSNCPPRKCEETGAALLRNGRIIALAMQYGAPPYDWDGPDDQFSCLDIFIDRLTPESSKWVENLRGWGRKGKKVRVHELSRMQEAQKAGRLARAEPALDGT